MQLSREQRYLLGQLPEAEEGELDARLLAGDETAEALAVAEDELYDAHARGELSPEQERAFAARCSGPRARLRSTVARELAERGRAREPVAPPKRKARSWGWLAGGLGLAVAAAAALLLVVGQDHEKTGTLELHAAMRGDAVAVHRIPSGVDEVRLEPVLDTLPLAGDRYRLTLAPPVAAASEGERPELRLPADRLVPGEYELRIERRRGDGDFTDVGRFRFRVER
jgi:hypothetical protein